MTMSPGDRIRALVAAIPEGRVSTYADVSDRIYGRRNGGLAIERALAAAGADIPRWRVLREGGLIPARDLYDRQVRIQRLRGEGVPVERGRVDMERYRHRW